MVALALKDRLGREIRHQADAGVSVLVHDGAGLALCLSRETALAVGDYFDHPDYGRVSVVGREVG